MHFHFKNHVKSGRGSSGMAVRYLERREEYAPDAATYARYHERTGAKWKDLDDLRYRAVKNLPQWAEGSAERFFGASAAHERLGGRWGTSIQASLPRELSREEQITLTHAWVDANLANYPTLWVLHEPISKRDGLPQPHVHILFSERLMNDGLPERSPEQMFRRYNAAHPERGGAQKARQGDRQTPARLRESWAASANVVLEQAGGSDWMDPRSFQVRGIERQAVRWQAQGVTQEEREPEETRTPETRAQEAALAAIWWTECKRTMGLTAAHLRDPQVALTLIAREVREPGSRRRELQAMQQAIEAGPGHARGAEAERDPSVRLDAPLIGNSRSKIYHAPGDPNYGDVQPKNQVHFWSHGEADEAGYRPAVNQHYGPGATDFAKARERLQADIQRLEREYSRVHGGQMRATHRERTPGAGDPPARSPRQLDGRQGRGMLRDDEDYGGLLAPELDKKRGRDGYDW